MEYCPTCDELQQKIRKLESEKENLRKIEQELHESQEMYRIHFTLANDVIYSIDPQFKVLSVSPSVKKMLGYTPEELIGRPFHELNVLASEYQERAFIDVRSILRKKKIDSTVYQFITKDGERRFGEVSGVPLIRNGQALAVISVARDITDRKRFEETLRDKERQLELQAKNLEEVNTALKVLLEHREEEKRKIQEDIVSKAEKLIVPYIEKLELSGISDDGKIFLAIIKSNLEELISSNTSVPNCRYQHLTPMEIQIADIIRQGKTSKEIASILNISLHAVSFHRSNIRKKFGLLHTKANLESYLQCAEPV